MRSARLPRGEPASARGNTHAHTRTRARARTHTHTAQHTLITCSQCAHRHRKPNAAVARYLPTGEHAHAMSGHLTSTSAFDFIACADVSVDVCRSSAMHHERATHTLNACWSARTLHTRTHVCVRSKRVTFSANAAPEPGRRECSEQQREVRSPRAGATNGIRSRVDRHTSSQLHARIHAANARRTSKQRRLHTRVARPHAALKDRVLSTSKSGPHIFCRKNVSARASLSVSVREKNDFLPDSSLSRGQIVCTNRDAVAGERTGEADRCDRRHERSHAEPSAAPHAVPLVLKVLTARDVAGTSAQQSVCRRCCATHTSIGRRLPLGATAPERSAQRPAPTRPS